MSLRYEVIATTNGPLIGVQVDGISDFGVECVRDTVLRQVIDTSDATMRAALIKLGWTPPFPAFGDAAND